MNPQVHTLANGLTVILVDTAAFPTITTLLLVGAGSRYEREDNNGIAHFFEHMVFKGSKKYPSSLTISSVIEGLGGVFNAFTSKDSTGYWIKSTTDNFEEVIDVLSDMVLNPLLLDEEIEREKGVIKEEINLYEDTPYRSVGELFEGLLYNGNPLGFDITGTKKTVSSFTRQTFIDYISELYRPTNAVLVVAGGLEKTRGEKIRSHNYLSTIEEKFKDWQDGKKAIFEPVVEKQDKPQLLVKHKKTEQAHFCLGFRTFSFNNQRKYALSVLATILGGGMSSRLFTEVRERRGLCYYISTGRELYADVGNVVTQAGVTNNLDKVRESIKVILDEHKKIARGEVRSEEINNAKELLKGRLLISMEDSSHIASFLGGRKLLENEPETPEDSIKKIQAVKAEEIIELAQEIFKPEKLNFAIIGAFENKSDFKDTLELW
ncbi:MAG: insulinase family protein [Candidatus Roizmanbacteria bacterium]|nr:MAG: insulinase family protein [Candidatus Roizmanbacteria bacterium]